MNINPYNQVLENMRRTEALIQRYRDDGEWHRAKADIVYRVENEALHVVVYGAYNAGKSTLINALLGEERARVGDIPTTDRVDAYDWNGYRLLDTPGVNAPIEHEQVTADQITRTKAVVLVVREGDQDAKDVYDRLFSMMEDKKAVFVILNHQLGSAEEIVVASKRISDILSQLAGERRVRLGEVETLPIYPVNLNTALAGRMRRHDKLLDHSGFTRFVDAFGDWTRQHDNENHHLSEIKDTVRALWYDPVIASLKELSEEQDESEADQLRDGERTLIGQKNRMHGAAYAMVEHEVSDIRSGVGELIRSSGSKEEADEGLRSLIQPTLKRIEGWLSEELEEIDARVTVKVEAPETGEEEDEGGGKAASGVREMIVENRGRVLKKVGEVVTDKDKVKGVLLAGRGTKAFGIRDILKLKGKWASTLDKWATGFTKVARGGLVVVQVVIAIWDAKRAHDRQEEANQEMKRLAVESNQTIESICGELRRDLVSAIDGVIEDTLGATIVRIRKRIEDMTKDWSERKRHYQELLDHRNQLEGIVFTSTQKGAAS